MRAKTDRDACPGRQHDWLNSIPRDMDSTGSRDVVAELVLISKDMSTLHSLSLRGQSGALSSEGCRSRALAGRGAESHSLSFSLLAYSIQTSSCRNYSKTPNLLRLTRGQEVHTDIHTKALGLRGSRSGCPALETRGTCETESPSALQTFMGSS